jgi:hypothetical protein
MENMLANNENKNLNRPTIITCICIIGLIGAFGAAFLDILGLTNDSRIYLYFVILTGLVSMYGLWNMRKWAVYLYTTAAILNQAILIKQNSWHAMALIIPSAILAVCYVNLSKMR